MKRRVSDDGEPQLICGDKNIREKQTKQMLDLICLFMQELKILQ